MAKEKLFTDEDFDKAPRPAKKPLLKWIGVAAVAVVAIVALLVFINKSEGDEPTPPEPLVQEETVAQVDETTDEVAAPLVEEQEADTPAEPEAVVEDTALSTASLDVESEALKVIRGDYGNLPERKTALGDRYQAIQARVNQLKRQGAF